MLPSYPKETNVTQQAALERAIIESYRTDIVERQRVCAVTGEPLELDSAVHLMGVDGLPTGFVFTPEGAERLRAGTADVAITVEEGWRFE